MAVERIKLTRPPPDVCEACWWARRVAELQAQNRALRRELVARRGAAKRGPGRPPKERDPDDQKQDGLPAGEDDVVEHFRKTFGRDE
jgi:hypothetical protein